MFGFIDICKSMTMPILYTFFLTLILMIAWYIPIFGLPLHFNSKLMS